MALGPPVCVRYALFLYSRSSEFARRPITDDDKAAPGASLSPVFLTPQRMSRDVPGVKV